MQTATLALTGDVMLGRLVDESVIRNSVLPPETVWGDVRPLLLRADLRFINLECVISDRGREWKPDSKAFHFRANPRAIAVLRTAKIDGVTLANNHVLDYGPEALRDCLEKLDAAGITHTGAGATLRQALEPLALTRPWGTVAVIGLTDNEPEWEAMDRAAGVHFIRYGTGGLIEPYRERVSRVIQSAKWHAQLVIVGLVDLAHASTIEEPDDAVASREELSLVEARELAVADPITAAPRQRVVDRRVGLAPRRHEPHRAAG